MLSVRGLIVVAGALFCWSSAFAQSHIPAGIPLDPETEADILTFVISKPQLGEKGVEREGRAAAPLLFGVAVCCKRRVVVQRVTTENFSQRRIFYAYPSSYSDKIVHRKQGEGKITAHTEAQMMEFRRLLESLPPEPPDVPLENVLIVRHFNAAGGLLTKKYDRTKLPPMLEILYELVKEPKLVGNY